MATRALQLALLAVVAASVLVSTAGATETFEPAREELVNRRSPFVGRTLLAKTALRTTVCTYNLTICIDPTYSPAGPSCCSGVCVDLTSSIYHCGSCSRSCSNGYTCCSGQCVYTFTDYNNCGKCGHHCTTNKKGKAAECFQGLCEYNGY